MVTCLSCYKNQKRGYFSLLFCGGQHGIVPKCMPHMHVLRSFFVCSTNQIRNFNFLICCVVVAVSVTSAKALKLQFKVGSADFSDWSVTLGKQHCLGGGLRVRGEV